MVRMPKAKGWWRVSLLQWSHVFSDMVRARGRIIARKELTLQWSHVFSDMVRNTEGYSSEDLATLLQWSHVFSDMVRYRPHDAVEEIYDIRSAAMSFQTW